MAWLLYIENHAKRMGTSCKGPHTINTANLGSTRDLYALKEWVYEYFTLVACHIFGQGFANSSDSFTVKVAPYSFTITRALMTKAQVICARSKENSVFRLL